MAERLSCVSVSPYRRLSQTNCSLLSRSHERSPVFSLDFVGGSKTTVGIGTGLDQLERSDLVSIPHCPVKLGITPTVSSLLTPIESHNILLLQSPPDNPPYPPAKVRRRKDDTRVGTAASGIIERLSCLPRRSHPDTSATARGAHSPSASTSTHSDPVHIDRNRGDHMLHARKERGEN